MTPENKTGAARRFRSSALFDNDMLTSIIKPRGPKWMGLSRYIPYPLRAVKLSLDLNIFGFWWKPDWHYRKGLTEAAKADGATIWWVRWLWFQVSYSRWV